MEEDKTDQQRQYFGVSGQTWIVGIGGAIVASILVDIFLKPISTIVFSLVLQGLSLIFSSYVDVAYANAAGDLTDALTFTLIAIILAGISGWVSGSILPRALRTKGSTEEKIRARVRFSRAIAGLFFLLTAVAEIATSFDSIEIRATYNRELAVLSPYISQKERLDLLSQWALIRSRDDYSRVISTMNLLAAKHKLQVPPSPFPPVF